jgi:hypothetical protein
MMTLRQKNTWPSASRQRTKGDAMSADEPATGNQQGRIMRELERLGWHDTSSPWERKYRSEWWNERYNSERSLRLALYSAVAGRVITSTRDMTRGEAGKVLSILLACASYDDLVKAVPSLSSYSAPEP